MPLTENVTFSSTLQGGQHHASSKADSVRFRMGSSQALKVVAKTLFDLHRGWQFFCARMRKDGRMSVPKLVLSLFEDKDTSLADRVVEVMFEPA